MSSEAAARARLALHQARAEAERALEAAKAAADRTRAFAIEARDRCSAIEEESRDIALDRSITVREALLAGETPNFEPLPAFTANAIALRELKSRAEAASIVAADLAAQESDAMRARLRRRRMKCAHGLRR